MVKEVVNWVFEFSLFEGLFYECWFFYLVFVIED